MTVGIVIVSHSERLAEGVVELAGQMAQARVRLVAAGGLEDGTLGTSIERVTRAIEAADSPDGVLVLVDLGSAKIIAEMVVEQLSEAQRARVRISSAPLVEGAVMAAVEASIEASLDDVLATADGALMVKQASRRT